MTVWYYVWLGVLNYCLKFQSLETKRRNHSLRMLAESENGVLTLLDCRYCGKKFPALRNQIFHEKLHTQEESFRCKTCGKVYARKSSFRKHVVNCNHQILDEKHIMSIQKKHLHIIKSTSDICNFSKEPQLSTVKSCKENVGSTQLQEVISNSSVKRPRHICPVCYLSLAKAETLKNHIAAHFNNSFYSCETCHENFRTKIALRRHKSKIPVKQNVRNFVQSGRTIPIQRTSKKPILEAKLTLSQNPVHVRRSPSEDPHQWPKVFLSGNLNNLLKLKVSV